MSGAAFASGIVSGLIAASRVDRRTKGNSNPVKGIARPRRLAGVAERMPGDGRKT